MKVLINWKSTQLTRPLITLVDTAPDNAGDSTAPLLWQVGARLLRFLRPEQGSVLDRLTMMRDAALLGAVPAAHPNQDERHPTECAVRLHEDSVQWRKRFPKTKFSDASAFGRAVEAAVPALRHGPHRCSALVAAGHLWSTIQAIPSQTAAYRAKRSGTGSPLRFRRAARAPRSRGDDPGCGHSRPHGLRCSPLTRG